MGATFSALVCSCPAAFLSAGPSRCLGNPPLARAEGPQDIASLPAKGSEVVESQELVKAATGSECDGYTDRGFGLCMSIPPRLPCIPLCLCVHPIMPGYSILLPDISLRLR